MYFRGIQPCTTFSLSLLGRFGLSRSGWVSRRATGFRCFFLPCGLMFADMTAPFHASFITEGLSGSTSLLVHDLRDRS